MIQTQATDIVMVTGRDVLEVLARRFPQLYVAPAEGAQEAHRLASSLGMAPEGALLAHFVSSPDDELRIVGTPAGPVEVVFLKNRKDFETFLQIVGHRSQPVTIAPTIGAITFRGLADWGKVADARAAYLAKGYDDWRTEFARLAKQPGAFRSELVVISEGPYSNISAAQTSYDEDEWLHLSREIRLHHECAHVVCRRMMPDDVLPIWDEVTADVVGLLCATGHYDAQLAALFLGVDAGGFHKGRLEEYLSEDQKERIDALAVEAYDAMTRIGKEAQATAPSDPFAFLLELKRDPLIAC